MATKILWLYYVMGLSVIACHHCHHCIVVVCRHKNLCVITWSMEVVSANGSSHNISGFVLFLWFSDSVSSQNLIPLQIVIYSINDCRFFDNSARNNIYLGTYTFCQQTFIVFNQPWTHCLSDYFYLRLK